MRPVVGVAAPSAAPGEILLVGARSMAAGGYVSVSSQSDTERANTARERRERIDQREAEHQDLVAIYVGRGLKGSLADEIAR